MSTLPIISGEATALTGGWENRIGGGRCYFGATVLSYWMPKLHTSIIWRWKVRFQCLTITFVKAIVLAKVDPLVHGAPTQRDSFAIQRGDPRAMSRMIKKCKDRSTYKKRQTRSVGSKRYATKQPDDKFPEAKKKMVTCITANRVGIESIGMSATRLNSNLPHHPEPLPHLEGKSYGYGRCCYLCRCETGNKYMAHFYYCEDCNIVLCVLCNKSWHSVQYIAGVKDVLCQEILLRNNSKGNSVVGRFRANKS